MGHTAHAVDTRLGNEAGTGLPRPLVDVSELSVQQLLHADDNALAEALRRVAADAARPRPHLGAFQSVVEN